MTPMSTTKEDRSTLKEDPKGKCQLLVGIIGFFVFPMIFLAFKTTGQLSEAILKSSDEKAYIFESFRADFDGSAYGNFEGVLGIPFPGASSTGQKMQGTFWWYSNGSVDMFILSMNIDSTNVLFWENAYWKEEDTYMSMDIGSVLTTHNSSQCILSSHSGPNEYKIIPANYMQSTSGLSSMKFDKHIKMPSGIEAERWIGTITGNTSLNPWLSAVGTDALWLLLRR